MTRNALTLFAATAVTIIQIAPALAQTVAQQTTPNVATTSSNPAAKKSGRPATDIGQSQTPGFSQLTEQECRNLGGAVHTAPQCKKTQQRCVIRLAGGQINAPCIDEIADKK
jgi:hypothetical protein